MSTQQDLKRSIRANERIRVLEVRLIDQNGKQVGVMATKDALELADRAGLDLVEVASEARPPVCRILDFGKYLYDIGKKEKDARKKQKVIAVKEVKISPKIGEHDYQTKLRSAIKFIERGDRVKLTMFFRGREITHMDIGKKIIARFGQDISDIAELEKDGGLEGRQLHMYYIPKVLAIKKAPTPADEKKPEGGKEGTNAQAQNPKSS